MQKKTHIERESTKYFQSLPGSQQVQISGLLFEGFLSIAEEIPTSDNIYVNFGMTRKGDKYAMVLHDGELVYGAYDPNFIMCLKAFDRKLVKWRSREADDFGRWPGRGEEEASDLPGNNQSRAENQDFDLGFSS